MRVGGLHPADYETVEIFKPFFFHIFFIEVFPHYLKTQWDCSGTEKYNPYVLEPFTIKSASFSAQCFKYLKCILYTYIHRKIVWNSEVYFLAKHLTSKYLIYFYPWMLY